MHEKAGEGRRGQRKAVEGSRRQTGEDIRTSPAILNECARYPCFTLVFIMIKLAR